MDPPATTGRTFEHFNYLGDFEEPLVVVGAVGQDELGQHDRGQVAHRHLVGARVLDDLRAQVARPKNQPGNTEREGVSPAYVVLGPKKPLSAGDRSLYPIWCRSPCLFC